MVIGASFERVEAAIDREDAEDALKLIDHALAQEELLIGVVQGTPLAATCQTGADLARSIRKAVEEGSWQEARSLTDSLVNMGDFLMNEISRAAEVTSTGELTPSDTNHRTLSAALSDAPSGERLSPAPVPHEVTQ